MSEAFENVIGGGLTLKGGVKLRGPIKRKKHKKEKKHKKKSSKKDKKKEKKDKSKEKRVRFETGELAEAADPDPQQSSELAIVASGEGAGGGVKEGEEQEEAYDPMNDPSLTATQKRMLEVQRNRYVLMHLVYVSIFFLALRASLLFESYSRLSSRKTEQLC